MTNPAGGAAAIPDDRRSDRVLILFGSQTGVALAAARRLQTELKQRFVPTNLTCLNQYETSLLTPPEAVIIVSSTFMSGSAPENACRFRELLDDEDALQRAFSGIPYAVLGVGHSMWPEFCRFTKDVDERLAAIGAHCLLPRLDADSADEQRREDEIGRWIRELCDCLIPLMAEGGSTVGDIEETVTTPLCVQHCCQLQTEDSENIDDMTRYDAARRLHGIGVHNGVLVHSSYLSKRVLHLELDVPSDCVYEPGDCVAIPCANPGVIVRSLLSLLCLDPRTLVSVPFVAGKCTLSWALTFCFDLCAAPPAAILAGAGRAGSGARNVVDLFARCAWLRPTADELADLLTPLAPRYYSIASSPFLHPGRIHLTVAVPGDNGGPPMPACFPRGGLCTAYLESSHQRRVALDLPVQVPLFVRSNRQLRLPCFDRPLSQALVMIGCGVGIAPFRAFLQHIPEGAVKAYLFFGFRDDQDEYLYRDEWHMSPAIEFIEVAFSRAESSRFRYVQDALRARADELIQLINSGAVFYVCGSLRMASDVYNCFVSDVLCQLGGMPKTRASETMEQQILQGRYMVEAWD